MAIMIPRAATLALSLVAILPATATGNGHGELDRARKLYQAREFSRCAVACPGPSGGTRLQRGLLALLHGQCAFYAGRHRQALGCFTSAERKLTGSLRRLARARRADTLWELDRRRQAVGIYWQLPRQAGRLVDSAAGAWRVIEFAREQERRRPGPAGKG